VNPKLEGVNTAVALGESGGVGCSSGLIDCCVSGSLRLHLSGIVTCRGDSCRFPVIGDGCLLDQLGGLCWELTTLWVVRLDYGAELKVTDPKEQQRDIEEEEAESKERQDWVDCW